RARSRHVLLGGALPGSPEGCREIDAVVLGQVLDDRCVLLLCCGDPGLERRGRKDATLLRHVAVPETAELRAADLEEAGMERLRIRDVVDSRNSVRLHAELVRPERMRDVERGDVKRDERVVRDGEVACLDAAVRWVAERPLPL